MHMRDMALQANKTQVSVHFHEKQPVVEVLLLF